MTTCSKCGSTDRCTDGRCHPCKLVYAKKYRDAHIEERRAKKEETRLYNAAYRATHKEALRARKAEHFQKNKARITQKIRAQRAADLANTRKKHREYSAAHKAKNIAKVRASALQWAKRNPEHGIRNAAVRRTRIEGQVPSHPSQDIITRLFALQQGACPCCGQPLGDDYHLDHIMPVALDGTSADSNLQLLRATCNRQKSAKHPIDFMQERGFLL